MDRFWTDRTRLIAIVLLVQAVLWIALVPLLQADAESIEYQAFSSSEIAELANPSEDEVSQASFEPFVPPLRLCCESRHMAVRFTFDLDELPRDSLGLLHEMRADAFQIWINGLLLHEEGSLALDSRGLEGRAQHEILRVPTASLKNGTNEMVFVLAAKEGGLASTVNEPLFGDFRDLQSVYGLRAFILTDYKLVSMAIGFMVGLIAFLAWFRGDRPQYLFWLGTVSTLWGCAIMLQLWGPMPVATRWRSLAMMLVYISLPFFWVLLINSWGNGRIPHLRKAALVALPVLVLVGAVGFGTQAGSGNLLLSEEVVGFVATVIGVTGLAAVLLWKVRHIDRSMHFEFAIYFAMITVVARELVLRSPELRLPILNVVLPILLLALATGFITRNIRLFRSSEQINAMLQTQLEERTAELALAHGREKELLREQAHQDERQRILRDMHDGLGSSLMSMLLSARRGKAEPEKVAAGLQEVIDEMRLLIDSMDTVGETLKSALTLFRDRARERVPESGFRFVWSDRSNGGLPAMAARDVLQVFRILQEALTNALKHSDGDTIAVEIESHAICVCDNGTKFAGPRSGGRGLANMEGRAQAIGGSFSIGRENDRTVARLELPARPGADDPGGMMVQNDGAE